MLALLGNMPLGQWGLTDSLLLPLEIPVPFCALQAVAVERENSSRCLHCCSRGLPWARTYLLRSSRAVQEPVLTPWLQIISNYMDKQLINNTVWLIILC